MADQDLPADVEQYLAESTAFAQEAERRVREHIDAYPFALEMLGAVFRGALAAGSMGAGTEEGIIMEMESFCINHLGSIDPASLPLFEKGSPA